MGFTEQNGTLTFAPAPDQQPKGKNWFARHKVLSGLAAGVIVIAVAGGAGGASDGGSKDAAKSGTSGTSQTQPAESKAEESTPEVADEPAKPTTTRAQDNAVEQAESYLDMSAFSRSGLIKQLEFEGYSKADATYGADHAGADWGVQAEKKAEEYLDTSAFSRSGLIEQLEFEGFTTAQAKRGVNAAGL